MSDVTGDARKFLLEYMRLNFKDRSFTNYIENELAGDFAFELARCLDRQAPKEAIAKMLAAAMEQVVANGGNSISMPDEYVEIAVWLSGLDNE